jgi:hypothetical protein
MWNTSSVIKLYTQILNCNRTKRKISHFLSNILITNTPAEWMLMNSGSVFERARLHFSTPRMFDRPTYSHTKGLLRQFPSSEWWILTCRISSKCSMNADVLRVSISHTRHWIGSSVCQSPKNIFVRCCIRHQMRHNILFCLIPDIYRDTCLSFSLPVMPLQIYRVIHKSLRDFRTRLRNNQDRHGRKEHINR